MPVHQHVGRLAGLAARLFYRLEVAGERAPATGPLLVVANHPNSLLDPALVTLAVGRSARFLAKATLFPDPKVGWLVRASGAIPVHRRQDGEAPPGGNDDTFRAAEAALLDGDAIALFPEGISHARPALAPLKTGVARLALQTAARHGGAFPLVPVGITLDDRAIFRSAGLLVVGAPVAWDDLGAEAARAGERATEPARVHELMGRIGRALAEVTVSFASWEDARLVALAEEVHGASATPAGAARLERHRLGASLLARLRADDASPDALADTLAVRDDVARLAEDLRRHRRLLGALRLAPADLAAPTDVGTAVGWAFRRVHLLLLGALAAAGTALGWVPYRVTGRVAPTMSGAEEVDVRATAKVLVGAACFLVWTLLLAAVAGAIAGWWAALAVLVGVPPLLVLALVTGEGWRDAWRDARRFLTLRRRASRVAELRARQQELARRVEAVVARLESLPPVRHPGERGDPASFTTVGGSPRSRG
ncbi:MAG: 1-acyl-sn-glycerol-3-phosphate acyltransferase [Gemmatirosa sp.]|nr:1-acyl-sn-glycerol-3-phosphate acyltransferase [Gemmatirosa sp.]